MVELPSALQVAATVVTIGTAGVSNIAAGVKGKLGAELQLPLLAVMV